MAIPFLRTEKISKFFPGIRALDSVSFSIEAGEIHALVGENGAGKSTLVKIIGGIYKPDSGVLYLNNVPVHFHNPASSQKAGISIIHQELSLALDLSIAENIFLGREIINQIKLINDKKMIQYTQNLLKRLGTSVNPTTLVRYLRYGQRQIVEIAKAMSQNAKLLILDEPTSSLTPHETDILFQLLKKLNKEGVSILYISHHLEEIFQISDRVSVFRDGQLIATKNTRDVTQSDLIQMMIGHSLSPVEKEKKSLKSPVLLSINHITSHGKFQNITFKLYASEILGIAGLLGSGRTEVVRAIFGVEKYQRGEIEIKGKPVFLQSPKQAVKLGIGLVPEDRRLQGLLLDKSIKENVSLPSLHKLANKGFIHSKKEYQLAEQMKRDLDIRCTTLNQAAGKLSGGNQQKVVIAKWLASGSEILILDEPTRGVDVGAKTEIHRIIKNLASQGKGILLISSDLPEIISLCDRILVMHEGRLTGELNGSEATQEEIMRMATLS